ncbi:hypothetical protein CH76_02985 [Lysinibacillus sp. BF-4]|uniref:DUF3169 family protein n=1 Tax=Lysinibacillus sp. BF-4 TaxID=1473546 RepID=UPI0005017C13|nr:DUF3169 family protein [Lysinibacillus sp. BF-4]KFL44087.1 hypothetical protein CH76_02985 [Lysinibacillus sp. BF-4]
MGIILLQLTNSIVILLLGAGYFYFRKITKSSQLVVTGEEEDQLLDKQYERAITVSQMINSAFILSLGAMAIGFIIVRESSPATPLLSFALLVCSVLSTGIVTKSVTLANPTRPIPNWVKEDGAFDAMDEGERHVALKAYYKVYKIVMGLLIISILLAMYYSVLTGQSQIMSIIVMVVLLLVMVFSYLSVIRRGR